MCSFVYIGIHIRDTICRYQTLVMTIRRKQILVTNIENVHINNCSTLAESVTYRPMASPLRSEVSYHLICAVTKELLLSNYT